jgi:hypothetical protein
MPGFEYYENDNWRTLWTFILLVSLVLWLLL